MASLAPPPGLGAPSASTLSDRRSSLEAAAAAAAEATSTDEVQMGTLLKKGDNAGVLALLERCPCVNVRMVNMKFTAQIGTGMSIETAAVEMLKTCEARGLTPTGALHNNVLAALSRREPPQLVLSWLARMRASACKIDRVACNIELKAHLALNDLAAATQLLFSMLRGERELPKPDAASFNTVISVLSATQPGKAETMLTTMLDTGLAADTLSYTSVIGGFAKASQPASAAKWLERMIEAGVTPDTIAFNTVLNAYANASDPAGAKRILTKFEERAFEDCPNTKPDVISFNTLISACARGGAPRDAEAAFERLVRAGIAPDQVSYSTVLSAHARSGHVVDSQKWLDAMLGAGIAPDAQSYNTVCSAHARVGDAPAALAVFQAMERAGVSASATTHAIMINALVQSGELDMAETGLTKLIASGEKLSASSFNTLISAHAKAGRADRAERLLDMMLANRVPPSIVSYNSLASAHAAAGDVAEAERVVGLAAGRGLALDGYSYGALLTACLKTKGAHKPAARARAAEHVAALLGSGVEMNDFLSSTSRRAVGDAAYDEMAAHAAQRGRRGAGRAMGAPSPRRTAEADADGWVTKSGGRRASGGRRNSREAGPSGGIKKASSGAPAKKAPSASASAEAPADVRLLNVPLTRSKSDRSRLLALAHDVVLAEGLPLSRNPSSGLALAGGVPLTRSAASELAITLGENMAL